MSSLYRDHFLIEHRAMAEKIGVLTLVRYDCDMVMMSSATGKYRSTKAFRTMSSISLALIQTPCYELEDDRLEPNLGLLYLATWLRQHGFAAQVINLSSMPQEGWEQTIPSADVYGFSTYTTSYHRSLLISRLIREAYPAARMVAGGPHASALPHSVAQDFDHVVVGEGESAILRLLDEMASGRMSSPILCEPPIADLDTLPFPDYSLVDVRSYHRVVDGSPSLSVLTSRGCPYDCVFCNSIIMGGGQRVRFRSAENIANEIRELKARFGVTCFRFQDDIFTLNLPRLHRLTALLQQEKITYRCFGRVDQMQPRDGGSSFCRWLPAYRVRGGIRRTDHSGENAQTAERGRYPPRHRQCTCRRPDGTSLPAGRFPR